MRIGFIHGYRLEPDGTLGPEAIGRCRKAAALWRAGRVDYIVCTDAVISCGAASADRIREHLRAAGVPAQRIALFPYGLNTAGEVEGYRRAFAPEHPVTAISSWYHLPRVWILWAFRGRLVRLAASWRGTLSRDIAQEPQKLFFAVTRPYLSARTILNQQR